MEYKKAFDLIVGKVEAELVKTGYTKQKVATDNENELVALFTSENLAYSVVYFKDKQQMVLRSCTMTEDGPDNEWKTLATWMFDPENDTQKEADSIANDFIDNCTSSVAIKRMKATKKKKKNNEDEGNADPLFLAKRFVSYFPELKDVIAYEEENYYPFRGVTFTKEKLLPRLTEFVNKANKKEVSKLCALLDKQYSNGNLDTRSIITIVILNGMPEGKYDWFKEFLSEDLNKAWGAALKYKGKKVKPAKEKKKKPTMMQRLQAQQQQQQ